MHLFLAAGNTASALTKTTLSALGMLERQHLQEWVIANPVVMGEDLLVITAEYDSWRGSNGVSTKDRLDVLALESSGRLVVAELKRNEDRDVHLQAINYAALVSRFTLDTLADAHAKFLTSRGTPTSAESALERLQEHAEDLDPDMFRTPRIVLIASNFPRIVSHTAVWLSEMGLDISLVQVGAWLAGEQVIVSFERLYPVPALEEFTLAPARQEAAAAKARAAERTRRGRSIDRLVGDGVLPVGTRLTIVPSTRVSPEERQKIVDWVAENPARGAATYNGDAAAALTWEVDATRWSPTGLAKHIVTLATGRRPEVLGGPRWWGTKDGVTLRALADSLADASGSGPFDWEPLHRILDQLPAGRWTTYGDLAAVVGTSPQPLGGHIAVCRNCNHAWRVLDRDGRVALSFKWSEPGRVDDPGELLVTEGIIMLDGRANRTQRLTSEELAGLADDL